MIDESLLKSILSKNSIFEKITVGDKNVFEIIDSLPKIGEWIPVSERLPKERDSIFKKAKGTDKWNDAMFEGISDDVNVMVEYEDGTRKTMTSHTLDGIWKCEKDFGIKRKVIAWMPLPPAYEG